MEDRATLAIRLATQDDVPAVMALVRACVADMRKNGIEQWDEIYPDEKTLLRDAGSGTLFIAEDDGGLIGVLVINEYQDPEYADVPWTLDGRVAVLHRLMVNPLRQRQGMARRLTEWAQARAAALGYDVMRLDAFTSNPRALRLYDQLGFRDAGGIRLRKGPFRCFEKRLGVES